MHIQRKTKEFVEGFALSAVLANHWKISPSSEWKSTVTLVVRHLLWRWTEGSHHGTEQDSWHPSGLQSSEILLTKHPKLFLSRPLWLVTRSAKICVGSMLWLPFQSHIQCTPTIELCPCLLRAAVRASCCLTNTHWASQMATHSGGSYLGSSPVLALQDLTCEVHCFCSSVWTFPSIYLSLHLLILSRFTQCMLNTKSDLWVSRLKGSRNPTRSRCSCSRRSRDAGVLENSQWKLLLKRTCHLLPDTIF